MKLDIELTAAQAGRLRQESERLNVTLEELARAALSDLLSQPDETSVQEGRPAHGVGRF
jgi:hypothetical protein